MTQMDRSIVERFQSCWGFKADGRIKGMTLPRPPPAPAADTYTFNKPDTDDNIVFVIEQGTATKSIKGGTLEKLVERLTYEHDYDPVFTKTFLLTYRTFASPIKLLKLLIARFHSLPKPGVTEDEWDAIRKKIRLRVFNTMRQWLLNGFYDFVDNEKLCESFKNFVEGDMMIAMPSAAPQLIKSFSREMNVPRGKEIVFNSRPPKPILPKTFPTEPRIIDFSAEEIARQLTIIESNLYRNIQPWELLNQSWAKKEKEKKAPRIIKMINRFNQVSKWVTKEIMLEDNLKSRVAVLRQVIEVAYKCMQLNNFNGVMEIISGLHTSALYRMKQTWSMIGSRAQKQLEECTIAMCHEQNFKNFRACLHKVNPPVVPYLGVYLTDLTFIEDGNGDFLPESRLINVVKRQLVSQVISEIQQYQCTPYCLESVPSIQEWLWSVDSMDEEQTFELSLLYEPRKSRDQPLKPTKKQLKVSGKKPSDPTTAEYLMSPFGELEEVRGYKFYEKDSPSNIEVEDISNDQFIIKRGTLTKLVERLTYERYPDVNYVSAFLMTYRMFTSASELLDLLIMRFNLPKLRNPSKEQENQYKLKKIIPIHFRVFNVLKLWCDKYFVDFRKDSVLVQRVLDFVSSAMQTNPNLVSAGTAICNILQTRTEPVLDKTFKIGEKYTGSTLVVGNDQENKDAPVEYQNPITWNLLEYDAEHIARQIHANTYRLLQQMDSREVLSPEWDANVLKKAPHLHNFYQNINGLKRWIKAELFWAKDNEMRVQLTGFFLSMAHTFATLADFHDCFVIVSCLETLKHNELKSTWEWLSTEQLNMYNILVAADPRDPLNDQPKKRSAAKGPVQIPLLSAEILQLSALTQSDLRFLDEGGMINLENLNEYYNIFSSFSRCQLRMTQPLATEIDPEIVEFLKKIPLPSDVELAYAAARIHSPTGVSPAETRRQQAQIQDDTTIDNILRMQLLDMVNGEDFGLNQIIYDLLREEILPELLQPIENDLARFTKAAREQFSLIAKCSSLGDRCQSVMEIASLYLPFHTLKLWEGFDTDGEIFESPSPISVVTACKRDQVTLVDAYITIAAYHIDLLQKISDFYRSTEQTTLDVTVFVQQIDAEWEKRASAAGINVIIVQ